MQHHANLRIARRSGVARLRAAPEGLDKDQGDPPQRTRRTGRGRRHGAAVAFVLPAAAIYGTFILYPLLSSLFGSLYTWTGITRQGFSGLGNFYRLLSDPYRQGLVSAFLHNTLWFVGVLLLQTLLGLLIAWTIFRRGRRFRIFQSI